jgi:hypothetical protein
MPTFADQEQDQQYSSVNYQNQEQQQQQQNSNKTGLPDDLKVKLEAQSGLDLSQVRVYYNSPLPAALGAHAFTRGMNIYLAPGAEQYLPEEAMHLLQQLQGQVTPEKQLTNGKETTSINENEGLEKDAVTTGKQLDKAPTPDTTPKQLKKPTVPTEEVVQMATKSSHYGDFTIDDAKYDFNATNSQLVFEVEFEPNDKADSTKVGLVQMVRNIKGGDAKALNPNQDTKMTDDGYRIDMTSSNPNPLYAVDSTTPDIGSKDATKLEDYSTDSGYGEHAEKDATGWKNKARLYDAPSINGGNNSSKEFETSALALEGNDKGEYYGSIKWGWKKDGSGNLSKIDFDLVSEGVPTKDFLEASKAWNDAKTLGSLKAKADDTKVYEIDFTTEICSLLKGIKVSHLGNYTENNIQYNKIKVLEGDNANEIGYVKTTDFEDAADGKDTVDLPIPGIKVPTIDNLPFGARKDVCLITDPFLPKDTRMKIVEDDGYMVKVEIVQGPKTGDQGWVEKAKLKDE